MARVGLKRKRTENCKIQPSSTLHCKGAFAWFELVPWKSGTPCPLPTFFSHSSCPAFCKRHCNLWNGPRPWSSRNIPGAAALRFPYCNDEEDASISSMIHPNSIPRNSNKSYKINTTWRVKFQVVRWGLYIYCFYQLPIYSLNAYKESTKNVWALA